MKDLKHLRLDMFSNLMPKVKYELNHALKDDGGAIRIDVKRIFRELDTVTKKWIKYYNGRFTCTTMPNVNLKII